MRIKKNSQEVLFDEGLPSNDVKTMYIEENALLIYWYIPEHQVNRADFTFFLARGAQLYFLTKLFSESSLSLNVYLQEIQASATICGYYRLHQTQQSTFKTVQHHQAPLTSSSLRLHGVLFDKAQADYYGTIVIDEGARFSKAAQSNKNFLFDAACAISMPNLEVKTNEVQCKHASAMGRVHDQQLFYVQSRGLSCDAAKKIFAEGFLQEVWSIVPDEILQTISKKT